MIYYIQLDNGRLIKLESLRDLSLEEVEEDKDFLRILHRHNCDGSRILKFRKARRPFTHRKLGKYDD